MIYRAIFSLAIEEGVEKIVAQMTIDQQAAITVFEGLGFRGEALLRNHVRDKAGRKHDLVVLSHDVARVRAQMEAFRVAESF